MEFRRCTHDFPNSLKSHHDNGNRIFLLMYTWVSGMYIQSVPKKDDGWWEIVFDDHNGNRKQFRRCTHDFPDSLKSHDDNGNRNCFCRCTHEFPECISNPYPKRMMVGGTLILRVWIKNIFRRTAMELHHQMALIPLRFLNLFHFLILLHLQIR